MSTDAKQETPHFVSLDATVSDGAAQELFTKQHNSLIHDSSLKAKWPSL